jgi:hypothetical protein
MCSCRPCGENRDHRATLGVRFYHHLGGDVPSQGERSVTDSAARWAVWVGVVGRVCATAPAIRTHTQPAGGMDPWADSSAGHVRHVYAVRAGMNGASGLSFASMAIQLLQRPDWHVEPIKLGDTFGLHEERCSRQLEPRAISSHMHGVGTAP